MAGRVGRRINDRFYFVLDEVGGSSDMESELVSEGESKSSRDANGEDCKKRDSDKNDDDLATKHKAEERDFDNEDATAAIFPADKAVFDDVDDENSDRANIDDSGPESNECKQVPVASGIGDVGGTTPNCPTSGVVDMDIDYDSDEEIEYGVKETVAPVIKITFRDDKVEKLYKSSLLKFLAQKIHPCTVVTSSENNLEVEIYEEETEKVLDDEVLDFHLDNMPTFDPRNNKVPHYGKNHDVVLSDAVQSKSNITKKEGPAMGCFNCGGNHNLRDCPHPKDLKEVNRKRNQFHATTKLGKNRYHLSENQRLSNLVPGELSKKLRNALGLRKDQQPLFIYRMRLLGYPPAWLEEARVSHSGVAIYDSRGAPVLEEDEEEGEIIAEGAKDRFDISKIIEFPGFNVPLQKHMKEEGKLHSCPGISEEQSKEFLIKTLQPNAVQAYKKRCLALPKDTSLEESSSEKDIMRRLSSPTIEEMEEKKRQLLLALNDEDGTSENKASGEDDSLKTRESPETEQKSSTPSKDISGTKTLDFGTPILKSVSPFCKLPSREQFSVNVSDVINFENLPNSTGKYESMSSIILKIRQTVSRIQNE